jgi:hypothetical protein
VERAWSVRGACVERAWSVRGACVERAWSVRGACVLVAGRKKRARLLVFWAVCMASRQALALRRRYSGPLQCDGAASGLDAASDRCRGRREGSTSGAAI